MNVKVNDDSVKPSVTGGAIPGWPFKVDGGFFERPEQSDEQKRVNQRLWDEFIAKRDAAIREAVVDQRHGDHERARLAWQIVSSEVSWSASKDAKEAAVAFLKRYFA